MRLSSSFILFVVAFFISISYSLSAQDREFGDVRIADFFNYDQSYDSTSPAIALFDVAKVHFDDRYNVYMQRHTRLKILNESGLDYGNIELVFDRDIDQHINDVRAVTYTMDKGNLKRSEISRKDVFEEKLVEDIYAKKFTMPNVEKGAILEYSYQKKLGNPFYLPDWEFHKEIPVQHSSIYLRIPWRFKYHMVFKGTDTHYITRSGSLKQAYENEYFIEISKDSLPPVEDLPFIDSRDNFISKVFTQLNFAYRDNGSKIEYLKDWEKISDEIRSHRNIGKQKTNREIRAKVEELTQGMTSKIEKMKKIFEFTSTYLSFNGRHQVISEKGIRDTFRDKTGSSGDINILLYKMLEEAGIDASYGLMSTRSNGLVLTDYPIINQFNHIVAIVELGGRVFTLDATEGKRSVFLPPVKNLYQFAYVVQDDSYGWYEVVPSQESETNSVLSYEIDLSGKAKAEWTNTSIGYPAQSRRNLLTAGNMEDATKGMLKEIENVHIDTVIIRGMGNYDNTAVHFTQFSFDMFNGDSLREVNYFNPFVFLADQENLLEAPTREFPLYFPYPIKESKSIIIKIPQEYMIDELPASTTVSMPDNKGMFSLQVSSTDSNIRITSEFFINKMFYEVGDYEKLREMFLELAASHSKTVVIKKINQN
ncbi:DUF3857 domain-containing protein [Gracilimonas sp.]|uniref:DUF3857 domain-containing protein n=1 Tax=Gracilimonas sp. TaxID=1974203 RepID=UPI0032EB4318